MSVALEDPPFRNRTISACRAPLATLGVASSASPDCGFRLIHCRSCVAARVIVASARQHYGKALASMPRSLPSNIAFKPTAEHLSASPVAPRAAAA